MQKYRADLHIHTVLSPCADVEMSPVNIVARARETGLQIIGITDHNSTRNAKLVKQIAAEQGIFTLCGVEVSTKEEVHCLAFFEHDSELDEFQNFLETNIVRIENPDGHFGYQAVLDRKENIIELVPYYLSSALKKGIGAVQKEVYRLNGIFIPAHVNRPLNGIFSHLGFLPPKLEFDALGFTGKITENDVRKHYGLANKISLLYNSDAHFLKQIGSAYSCLNLQEISFPEIKMALNQKNNRFVEIV